MEDIGLAIRGTEDVPGWPSARVAAHDGTPSACQAAADRLFADGAVRAVVFWDPQVGTVPTVERARAWAARPADVIHAGARLVSAAVPGILASARPAWMQGTATDPATDATSWRVSLRAALVHRDAWRAFGGLDTGFASLLGAGLEFGHRCLVGGAVVRHDPTWLPTTGHRETTLDVGDEMRFARVRFGRTWAGWGLLRAVLAGRWSLRTAWRHRGALRKPEDARPHATYASPWLAPADAPAAGRVSVLIPTLSRYPYLDVLLPQLARQSVPPHEVVLVDQTPRPSRREDWAATAPGLPLRVLVRDEPGQCSARNAGLEVIEGDFILFLDDDDEASEDLIERHLRVLGRAHVDASCGVIQEDGAGPLAPEFQRRRVSDVLPTGNTMLRRERLAASGWFDLAFDRRARADWDLGTRLHRAGALLALQPDIAVEHRRAPDGGLRTHGARVATYAGSRKRIFERNLPSISDFYRVGRYFPEDHVRELAWQGALGTFRTHGSAWRQLAKVFVATLQLPDTVLRIRHRRHHARILAREHPTIPHQPASETD